MKNRKYLLIAFIIICFVALGFYALMAQKELSDYKTGFHLKRTYLAGVAETGDAEYLAFYQEEGDGVAVFIIING